MKAQAWNVYLGEKQIDTVFFEADCSGEYIKDSLINHDGYNPNIFVKKVK